MSAENFNILLLTRFTLFRSLGAIQRRQRQKWLSFVDYSSRLN